MVAYIGPIDYQPSSNAEVRYFVDHTKSPSSEFTQKIKFMQMTRHSASQYRNEHQCGISGKFD